VVVLHDIQCELDGAVGHVGERGFGDVLEGVAPHVVDLLKLFVCHEIDIVGGESNEPVVVLEELVADVVLEDVGV
jgi:hypothetical protein